MQSVEAMPHAFSRLLGRPLNDANLAEIKSAASARTFRVVKKGDMITMDHVADRLTIVVDDHGNVARIYMG